VPAPAGKPPVLAVIPGNPGDAVFYRELVRALEEHGHEVTVASHLLLSDPPGSLLPYAVHQAEAVTRYLAATGRTAEDVELVLLGHSVGAYLAYLIVARGLLPVARVFLLCPFLTRPSLSGRLILKLVTSPRLLGAGLRCWRALPRWLQRRMVAVAGAGSHGDWVLSALASQEPAGWAAMATAEVAEIASRPDASYLLDEPLFRDPERCTSMLCRRDRWAPRAVAPPAARLVEGITHAFVVAPAQCRIMARVIHDLLAP
jgi:pimeloyl-ACP methyl ester carboxylesterase